MGHTKIRLKSQCFNAEQQQQKMQGILQEDRSMNYFFCFDKVVARDNKKCWKSLVKSFSPFLNPLPVQDYSSEYILLCLVQVQLHMTQAMGLHHFSLEVFLQSNRYY